MNAMRSILAATLSALGLAGFATGCATHPPGDQVMAGHQCRTALINRLPVEARSPDLAFLHAGMNRDAMRVGDCCPRCQAR